MHRIPLKKLREINRELNEKSPSFCLAKWLQATVHLQNGLTHSCHHPKPHKIDLKELSEDHSALHNTSEKLQRRKEMLEGTRPSECEYCWFIEDAAPENISDRTQKSAEDWAYYRLNEIALLPWDTKVNPAYLEVSFGSECNFKCAYCSPAISSSIMNETLKFGPYKSMPHFSLEEMIRNGQIPIEAKALNPYIDAFWKWWPELKKDLKVFRITGGEPLLNHNTFLFMDRLLNDPLPNLKFSINSNLGISSAQYNKFLEKINQLSTQKAIKSFSLYTSVDTFGTHAEFIRFGLDFKNFMNNVELFLNNVPECELIFICTYNLFSVINFNELLKVINNLKLKYRTKEGTPRVLIDIPYLRDPGFLSAKLLTPEFATYIEKDIAFMKENALGENGEIIFYEHEISKMERILNWFKGPTNESQIMFLRKDLISFLEEYQLRKGIRIEDYIPEYLPFIKSC